MSYYYPQQQPIAAPAPAYHYPQPAPQPVYYPQPQLQPQPVYHAQPQPQYAMPQAPPPVYQRSNSVSSVNSSFGGSGASIFGSMGAVEGKNDEERMYYSTLKVLNEQVNAVYQSKLVHGWSNMTIIASAVHRHAEGLRRKGKIADEIIEQITALLEEEDFDLEARYEEQGGDYWALSSAIRWVRALVLVFQAEAIDIYFPTYAAEQMRRQQEEAEDDGDERRPRRRKPQRRGTQGRGKRRRR